MRLDDFRQSPQRILDSLPGREEAEGEKHRSTGHAEVVFVKIRICKRDIRYPMRNYGDFVARDAMDVAEHFGSMVRHNHQLAGAIDEIGKSPALLGCGIGEHGVERRDDWHAGAAQKIRDIPACRTSENTEFMLHAEHIGVREI